MAQKSNTYKTPEDLVSAGMTMDAIQDGLIGGKSIADIGKEWEASKSHDTNGKPSKPSIDYSKMSKEDLIAALLLAQSQGNQPTVTPNWLKTTMRDGKLAKGTISLYGISGRFPVAGYAEMFERLYVPADQWETLPEACKMGREVLKLIAEDRAKPAKEQRLSYKSDTDKLSDETFKAKYGTSKDKWEAFLKNSRKESKAAE